jgi:hypothetical protein
MAQFEHIDEGSSFWLESRKNGSVLSVAQAVAENLSEVNAPLKESLHETIAHYWEAQSVN